MSYIIPARDIDIARKQEFRSLAIESLIVRALALELARNRYDFVIRDLMPQDLGLPNWGINIGPNSWISATINRQQVVGIYKVMQLGLNPTASGISFRNSGSTMAIFNLESCYGGLPIIKNLAQALVSPEAREVLVRMVGPSEIHTFPELGAPMEGYFSEPIIYNPRDFMTIALTTSGASDYLVLGGFVCEPKGITVI
jgi:hypothetical protein